MIQLIFWQKTCFLGICYFGQFWRNFWHLTFFLYNYERVLANKHFSTIGAYSNCLHIRGGHKFHFWLFWTKNGHLCPPLMGQTPRNEFLDTPICGLMVSGPKPLNLGLFKANRLSLFAENANLKIKKKHDLWPPLRVCKWRFPPWSGIRKIDLF